MLVDEEVLCLPRDHVQAVVPFEGFRRVDADTLSKLLDPRWFRFEPRSTVETDPNFLQIIPYLVLEAGDQIFHYRRGQGGTETRLTARRSLGVGGHISREDAGDGSDPYRTGLLRELTEEVVISAPYTEQVWGLIYDPRTPVGTVHLGIVHRLHMNGPFAKPREEGLADAGFSPRADLFHRLEEFESWSQLVLESMMAE